MLILGFVLFTLLVLATLVYFSREFKRDAERKQEALNKIRIEVNDAVKRQDVTDLRRIKLMYDHKLDELDEGLSQRIDELADTLDIENYSRK